MKMSLLIACLNNNTELAKYLINNGADINVQNKCLDTPLMLACRMNNFELFKYLIDKGADPLIKGAFNHTVMSLACLNNNIEIVKLLIQKGVSSDVECNKFVKSYVKTFIKSVSY
jgi:ankyrin repeat protein